MNKNKAFTLAEILITLAIIGIVAAMTIPGLIKKTNEMENKKAYKKAYADLSQAITNLAREQGGSLKGAYADDNTLRAALKRN